MDFNLKPRPHFRSALIFCLFAVAGGSLVAFANVTSLPDFTPHGTQPGLTHVLESPNDCQGCHSAGQTSDLNQIAFNTWAGTMKANATRDPLFWAALDVANRDVPGIGDFCLRCHTSQGWYGGRVHKTGGLPVAGTDGCMLQGDHDDADTSKSDFSGITCANCHRQTETGPGNITAPRDNGNLFVHDTDCGADFGPCRFGPYEYGPEDNLPFHNFAYSAFTRRSEFCSSCHEVTSPTVNGVPLKTLIVPDGGGNPAGINTGIAFPIERTYREWRASDFNSHLFADGFAKNEPRGEGARFGQTCQSCHMRTSNDPSARAANMFAPGSRTGDLPKHEFAGANVWMLDVLKAEYGGAGGLNRETEFNQSKAIALEMLTQQSASLQITAASLSSNQVLASVRVTNLAGHKLPTGYSEGRRMWLNLKIFDANNQLVLENGVYDPNTGTFTSDAQTRVYEIKHGTWNSSTGVCETTDGLGRAKFHFALNNCIAKDNRIPPQGFRGMNDLEIAPVPVSAYPETAPGSGVLRHWDEANYTFPLPPNTPLPLRVEARLQHQIASKEYIEFLRNVAVENSIPNEDAMCVDDRPTGLDTGPQHRSRGVYMHELWQNHGRSPPVEMEMASRTITGTR